LSNDSPESKGDAMSDQNALRAIVSRWSGGLQAQLLELDLAVQGENYDRILLEFAHAITVSFEVSVAHGEAPFASIGEPPKAIRDQWRSNEKCCDITTGWIELRDEVAMALATALRWRKPAGSVVFEQAVAA
jgi:hypothetical protein